MYIYICIYIRIYVHICAYMCIFLFIYIYLVRKMEIQLFALFLQLFDRLFSEAGLEFDSFFNLFRRHLFTAFFRGLCLWTHPCKKQQFLYGFFTFVYRLLLYVRFGCFPPSSPHWFVTSCLKVFAAACGLHAARVFYWCSGKGL